MAENERYPTFFWRALLIIAIGTVARIFLLDRYPFHADEALFATLARHIANGSDSLLTKTTLLVDKPPLFYALLSLGVALEWSSELAARLPGFFASVISIALAGDICKLLWGSRQAGWIGMLLMGTTPLILLYSPTALADSLMLAFWMGAVAASLRGRTVLTGLLASMALFIKANILLVLPLPTLLWLIHRDRSRSTHVSLLYLAAGAAPPFMMTALIEAFRPGGWSLFAGGAVNDPGRLARSSEIWARLLKWGGLLAESFGGAVLLLFLMVSLLLFLTHEEGRVEAKTHSHLLIASFLVAFASFWLVAFPLFDRYLLPLAVILIFFFAGGISNSLDTFLGGWQALASSLLWIALLANAASVLIKPAEIGPFSHSNDGLDEVAAYLEAQPDGTVLYTESLGWQMAWVLYDQKIYLAVTANPTALTEDMAVHAADGSERYLLLAASEPVAPYSEALEAEGFSLCHELETANSEGDPTFRLYKTGAAGTGFCPHP